MFACPELGLLGWAALEMSLPLEQLHDASLVGIHFDWTSRTCHFEFTGAPRPLERFTLTFIGVTERVIPASRAWGSSVTIFSAQLVGAGRYEFAMQSGDTITVVAPNNSLELRSLCGAA
jgi:hypothetical protein